MIQVIAFFVFFVFFLLFNCKNGSPVLIYSKIRKYIKVTKRHHKLNCNHKLDLKFSLSLTAHIVMVSFIRKIKHSVWLYQKILDIQYSYYQLINVRKHLHFLILSILFTFTCIGICTSEYYEIVKFVVAARQFGIGSLSLKISLFR